MVKGGFYFFSFWLRWLFVIAHKLSPVVANRRCCLVSVRGAQAVGAWASGVAAQGLSCSIAHGIFPDQKSNPCSLLWQADSLSITPPGKSRQFLLILTTASPRIFMSVTFNLPFDM